MNPKHTLPVQQPPLIGREDEAERLITLLHDPNTRLITVLAPGGMGKTHLVLHVAERLTERFSDGLCLIAIHANISAEDFTIAIADAVGCPLDADEPAPQVQLFDWLQSRVLLLVLDNCEHLDTNSAFLSELLRAAPQIKILATSRQKLNQSIETVFELGGLRTPAQNANADIHDSAAVKFFIATARRTRPDFEPTSDVLNTIADICRLTRGMPLALLLASSWLSVLTCADIADEIRQGLDILATDMSDVPDRQRSIRAVFDFSWRSLSRDEQLVFAKLSVFAGDFTREAAATIAGATLPGLLNLNRQSLLHRQAVSERFYVHELLRQYAAEHLAQFEETAAAQATHGGYFLRQLAVRTQQLKGDEQLAALNTTAADFQDMLMAWGWAVEQNQYALVAAALDGFFWYTMMHSRYATAEATFAELETRLDKRADAVAILLYQRVQLRKWWMRRWREGSFVQREEILDELSLTLERLQRYDAPLDTAICLLLLGDATHALTDNLSQSFRLLEDSYRIFQCHDDAFYTAWVLHFRAQVVRDEQGIEQSIEWQQQALDLRRRHADLIGTIYSLYNLSADLLLLGQLEASEQTASEMLELSRAMGEDSGVLMSQTTLGWVAFLRGQIADAEAIGRANLKLATDLHHLLGRAHTLIVLGLLAHQRGNAETAAALFAESAELATQDIVSFFLNWATALTRPVASSMAHLVTALSYARDIGATGALIWCLPVCALVEMQQGNRKRAASLLGLNAELIGHVDNWSTNWSGLGELRSQLASHFDADGVVIRFDEQISTDLNATIAVLVAAYGGTVDPTNQFAPEVQQANQKLLDPLSTREIEVLQLLANGMTNREIAEQLFVQVSTIKKHTSHIQYLRQFLLLVHSRNWRDLYSVAATGENQFIRRSLTTTFSAWSFKTYQSWLR